MKIIRFNREQNSLKIRVDNLEDLWSVQRVLLPNDLVKSESVRRFRSTENDKGELKDVIVKLRIEKTELDRSAQRLRIMGKIVEGKPEDYVRLNAYHTLNIAPEDVLEITKPEWHSYIRHIIDEAVERTGRARLGLIALDEEKALPAYLLGYGIEFIDYIYSKLSKRMKPKDFDEQQVKYFDKLVDMILKMNTDLVVVAGPGFTKDNLKKYMDEKGITKKMTKRVLFMQTSNTERSGIYELIKSDQVSELLSREQMQVEFRLMESLLKQISLDKAHYGMGKTLAALENNEVSTILVNDSVLYDDTIKRILNEAERLGLKIQIFNSEDEAGQQLHNLGDIAGV